MLAKDDLNDFKNKRTHQILTSYHLPEAAAAAAAAAYVSTDPIRLKLYLQVALLIHSLLSLPW